jgi:hypothetical protein
MCRRTSCRGAHGWNIDWGSSSSRLPVQPFGEWNAGGERSGPTRCWVLRERATDSFETEARGRKALGLFGRGPVRRRTTGEIAGKRCERDRDSRPYLENCTVDASI